MSIVRSCIFRVQRSVRCERRCPVGYHFIRIQTAEVNATKCLLRGAGWFVGTRGSLQNASRWERPINALAVEPQLQTHTRFHYAVWQPTRAGIEEGPFTQTVTRRFRLTPKPAGRLAVG